MAYLETSSGATEGDQYLVEMKSREDAIALTNLFCANDNGMWRGWNLFVSNTVNPHMTDSYCNWIELTRREFSYLMDLIPALNRDGLPEEVTRGVN